MLHGSAWQCQGKLARGDPQSHRRLRLIPKDGILKVELYGELGALFELAIEGYYVYFLAKAAIASRDNFSISAQFPDSKRPDGATQEPPTVTTLGSAR